MRSIEAIPTGGGATRKFPLDRLSALAFLELLLTKTDLSENSYQIISCPLPKHLLLLPTHTALDSGDLLWSCAVWNISPLT